MLSTRPVAMSAGIPLDRTDGDAPDACTALLRAADEHPGNAVVTVTEPGRPVRLGYADLLLRARRLLAGLRANGCRPGDAVLLHGLALPDFFPALWACVLGGLRPAAVAEPLAAGAPAAHVERFAHLCRLLGGPLVLTDPRAVPVLREAAAGFGTGPAAVLGVGECTADEPAGDLHRPDLDDVALLMLSSGSTGLPKAVQLTHRGLAEFAAATRRVLDVRPEHTTVNWMPLDHSGALLIYHVLGVFTGATNVHAPTELILGDPLRWLDLLDEHRARHTWAPNFAYQLVAAALEDNDRTWNLAELSTVVSGGEQVTVPVVSRFLDATRRFGLRDECLRPAWGMAETTTAFTFGRYGPAAVHRVRKSSTGGDLEWAGESTPDDECVTLVSVGAPVPGAAVRVVDEHGELLPEGRIGRLQVRSCRVTPGYLGDEPGTRALFPDHERTGRTWLDSGDLAFLVGGEVVITGRAKDMIILNGHNYFCHEIEDVVATVPGLALGRVAACGVPDERTGSEQLHVFVATDEPDPAALAGEVRAVLFERLRLSGCRVVAVPEAEFPRTPAGKVRRAALRERAQTGAAPSPVPADPARAREVIGSVLATVLGREVDADTPFYELGLTSVGLMRARGMLATRLGREIPPTALFRHPTVSALAGHLAGAAGPAPDSRARPATGGHVAIIGIALRFPGANTPEQYWANLRDGVDSVRRFTAAEVAAAGVPAEIAGAPAFQPVAGALDDVDAFDADFFGVSPREAELTDPAHRLFVECCHHALEHAGYAGPGRRVGVFAGSGMNLYGHQDIGRAGPAPADGPAAMQATIGSEPDFLASRVAYRLGLTGPAIGVQTACSTSLVAVHLAVQALLAGDADMALAGAAAVRVPQEAGYRHQPGSILSPTGRCRAFDAAADGTVGGNGVAAVLLKPLEAAVADGDTVHAVILGSAVNNDGTGKVGFTAPSVPGQVEVVRQALRKAGVGAETVSYVEAHGTGTELGDPVEFDALCEAFGTAARAEPCALGSVKPNVGHLDSCAGMAGLIKVALMLRHRELAPTIHLNTPNPALGLAGSPFTLATERREWTVGEHPRRAGISALGVGGTNAHVILEEPPAPAPRAEPGHAVLVPVSAVGDEPLRELAAGLAGHLRANPDLRAADVAATLGAGRRHLGHRLAVVGRSAAELAAALSEVPAGEAPALGRLVFAFPGQDGLRPGLATELYAEFPVVREVLDECERVRPGLLVQLCGGEVRDGQAVLFAYQAALVALWRAAGIEPAVVAGHSLGEYAALHAAGALSLVDGVRLVAARGEAMRATEPGGMVVVQADAAVAGRLAATSGAELAAVNGPAVHVLSGPEVAVSRVVELARAERVGCVRLGADRAFHSALVEPALAELSAAAAAVRWRPLRVPLVSGLDGRLLPAGHVPDAGYLRRHAREAVRFDLVLSGVDGMDVVEVGPGEALSRLARRAGARWSAAQPRNADAPGAFLAAVGELYRGGATVDWRNLTMNGRRIPLPGYPFRKQRFPTGPVAEPAAEPAVAGPADRLAEVCELTARLLGTEVVDPDRTFVDLGGDSLSLMNMSRDLAEAFDVRVPIRALFQDADTPRKLAALIGPGPSNQPCPSTPVAAVPEPAPLAVEPPPAPEPPAETAGTPELRGIVERQLAVAEQMVDRVTSLMSEQLAALRAGAPADVAPPPTVPATPSTQNPPPAAPPRPATQATPPAAPDRPTTQATPTVATAPPVTVPAQPTAVATPGKAVVPVQAAPVSVPAQAKPRPGTADFSLYFFGDYPDERQADKYGLITAAARFADRHGFHALWLPERHFHSFGALFPNPSVLAAALAGQTERIRLHAGSVVLPLHNPIRVAEEWSVVDNLSGGRAGICVASGWHATDFALAPDNFGKHRELMYTQLDTFRRLWAGEAVPATSGSGDPVEIRVHPRPLQEQPPMYVAVVGNPDSYRRAAAADLGIVTNLMAQSVEQLTANIELYRRTRAEHGLDPDAGRVVVLVHTYVGDDLDRVRAEAFAPFCSYLRSSLSLFDQVTTSLGVDIDLANTPEEDVDFLLGQAYRRYCESRALIGTTDSCADVVTDLLAAGADEIACFVDFGVPTDQVLAALPTLDGLRERFAGERQPERRQELTAAQRRIWFLDRLYPNQTIYHEPKAIRLTGPLDPDALRGALRRIVDRQPALRTVFRDEGGEPYRTVLPEITVDCPLVDGTGGTEEDALREALRTTGREVFDLAAGPLLAARLVRLSTEHHLLFLSAHHIVFDSSSTAVLVRDLAACYRAWPVAPADLPDLSIVDEPAPVASDEDVAYWHDRLADAPELRLPADHPRPANRTGAGAFLTHEVDGELMDRLHALAQAGGVTPFMGVLGAVAAVLGRFGGQDDLVLGTAVTNRPRAAADLVGLYLDTVPLRVDLSGDPGFTDLARRVRDTTIDAYEHRGVPFDELVGILNPERDPGRNPLFDVMVEYENEAGVEFAPPGLAATLLDVPADRAPFDLSFYLTRHPGGLRISVEYDTDLFAAATVRGLVGHFEATLRRAVDDPAAPLSRLTSATDAERAEFARRQGEPLPEPPCLHELVERQADRTPDAPAVAGGDVELSYRDLDERANRLAHWLLERGIGRGDLVAVRLDRGPDLVAALLGVLKSGAAYLPLDPALPQARVDLVLADSAAALVLTADVLPGDGPTTRPAVPVEPGDLAYCIYTSGSSGRPKGVLVPHRGPANVVRWQAVTHRPLRTLQWTSPAFDVSVQEIFGTLAGGACLVLVGDDARHEPGAVADIARRHGVERLFMPYTPLKYLLESRPSLPALREVVSAGEPMVLTPGVRRFFAEHPDCVLYNQYGPTEGSIIVTSHRVDPAAEPAPPIGTPIAGVTVDLLDPAGEPVPAGATGEIHIGGLAVAGGYLGRADETAAAFVDDPHRPGKRLYRTGDLARWRPDGTVEFLGRRDDQVKIRGFRVEPGETERALGAVPGVRDAAVVTRTGPTGEPELVAYVVLEAGTALDTLAPLLREELPHYLVPHHWVGLDRLPVTPSGKLDRSGLPDPAAAPDLGAEPATPAERELHELWAAELGRAAVPVDRSFFALGGHSLSAVRLLNRVAERFGRAPSMTGFFRNPTIRALASLFDEAVGTGPLTTVQRRLWRRHHGRENPAVYNVAHRVDLTGDLDVDALRQAVEALVHRHAALRSRIVERGGDLVQEVLAPAPVPLEVAEVTDADAWCAALAAQPFALDTAPLHRFRLGRLGAGRWVLAVVLNHAVCDGVSLGVLWRDLAELYAAARDGQASELPAVASHADHARQAHAARTGPRRAELERFWRAELSGVDLLLRLPADRPRTGSLSGRGGLYESVLPASLAAGVESAAAAVGSTPYAVLATAFGTWLAAACDRPEVVLATSSANRTRPEDEGVVGMIGDAVLVRVPPEGSLAEQVRGFSAHLFAALDHQDLPLDEVVAAVAPELAPVVAAGPFPTVLFTVVTTPAPRLDLAGVESRVDAVPVRGLARTELYVRVAAEPDGLRVYWEYSTDLFTPATVASWDAGLRTTLVDLLASARSTEPVG